MPQQPQATHRSRERNLPVFFCVCLFFCVWPIVCYNALMFPQFATSLLATRWPAKLLISLALLPVLTGCGTQTQNTVKINDDLSEALRHVQVDPTDKEARQWADRAIAVAPNDSVTYFGDPNAPLPRVGVASVFGDVGDDPALADYMAQAVQKFPNDYRGYQSLMDAQGRLGRDADRKATAQKLIGVLSSAPQKPGATDAQDRKQALAEAYFAAGDVKNGTAQYQAIIQAYPTQPLPLNNLAYNLATANTDLPQALNLSEQSLALARKNSDTDEQMALLLDTLGWVQYRQGDFKNAAQNLEQAAALLPREAETRYHLGMVYTALGEPDAARAELGHAVLLSQDYAAAEAALKALPPATPS